MKHTHVQVIENWQMCEGSSNSEVILPFEPVLKVEQDEPVSQAIFISDV